jgi:hypothetical protein
MMMLASANLGPAAFGRPNGPARSPRVQELTVPPSGCPIFNARQWAQDYFTVQSYGKRTSLDATVQVPMVASMK